MKENITEWLESLIVDLKENYNRLGLRASGNWERQLESNVIENSHGFNAIILGEQYSGALEYGRSATSEGKRGRLYSIILKWIDDKGINVDNKKSFAYLVSRKIDREGIRVPNPYNAGGLLTSVITDERIGEIGKRLLTVIVEQTKSDIIKEWR